MLTLVSERASLLSLLVEGFDVTGFDWIFARHLNGEDFSFFLEVVHSSIYSNC